MSDDLFEVRGSGLSWCVIRRADGARVSPHLSSEYLALSAQDRLERAARLSRRACLRCREPFESEGPHNRLCNACRRHPAAGLPAQMLGSDARAGR